MKFSKRKRNLFLLFVAILFISGGVLLYFFNPYYWYLENHNAEIYDLKHFQKPVITKDGIDSVLNSFGKISYDQLNKEYIKYSQSDEEKYRKILKGKTYYIVTGDAIFKYLVGNYRVKDFLANDKYYNENLKDLSNGKTQYLLIDKELLYTLLQLQNKLEALGHNKNGFSIDYAHRHPYLNEEVGGASVSYHIRGQAIDLTIFDINKDGKATKEDKQIVLDLLDVSIIKDKGGIGRYPWSQVVHFDVRGYRARWDKQ